MDISWNEQRIFKQLCSFLQQEPQYMGFLKWLRQPTYSEGFLRALSFSSRMGSLQNAKEYIFSWLFQHNLGQIWHILEPILRKELQRQIEESISSSQMTMGMPPFPKAPHECAFTFPPEPIRPVHNEAHSTAYPVGHGPLRYPAENMRVPQGSPPLPYGFAPRPNRGFSVGSTAQMGANTMMPMNAPIQPMHYPVNTQYERFGGELRSRAAPDPMAQSVAPTPVKQVFAPVPSVSNEVGSVKEQVKITQKPKSEKSTDEHRKALEVQRNEVELRPTSTPQQHFATKSRSKNRSKPLKLKRKRKIESILPTEEEMPALKNPSQHELEKILKSVRKSQSELKKISKEQRNRKPHLTRDVLERAKKSQHELQRIMGELHHSQATLQGVLDEVKELSDTQYELRTLARKQHAAQIDSFRHTASRERLAGLRVKGEKMFGRDGVPSTRDTPAPTASTAQGSQNEKAEGRSASGEKPSREELDVVNSHRIDLNYLRKQKRRDGSVESEDAFGLLGIRPDNQGVKRYGVKKDPQEQKQDDKQDKKWSFAFLESVFQRSEES